MDDSSLNSQFPEVFWDCGSPSPNTWKKYQGSTPPSSSNKKELLQKVVTKQHVTKPRNIFRIDSKSLDKAHTVIAQLQSMRNEKDFDSSLEKIFDQSNGQEDLASSVASLSTTNGSNIEDLNQAVLAEFWDEDPFRECFEKGQDNSKCLVSFQTKVNSTSTPHEKVSHKKSLSVKKRQANNNFLQENLTKIPKVSTANRLKLPFNEMKESNPSVNFNPSKKQDKLTKLPHETSYHINKENLPLPVFSNSGKSNLVSNVQLLQRTAASAKCFPVTSSRTALNKEKSKNINISDEELFQLFGNDSWAENCTVNCKNSGTTTNSTCIIDSALTQLLMDDTWDEELTNRPTSHAAPPTIVSKSLPFTNYSSVVPTLSGTAFANSVNFVSSNSQLSSDDLEATLPVPCCNSLPPRGTAIVKEEIIYASTVVTPNLSSKFKFKAKISVTPSKQSSQVRCSAAEIEQKRLKALQRKRKRNMNVNAI